MDKITGSRLRSADGDEIGEITDVIGADASLTPEWVAVKTGWFSHRSPSSTKATRATSTSPRPPSPT